MQVNEALELCNERESDVDLPADHALSGLKNANAKRRVF